MIKKQWMVWLACAGLLGACSLPGVKLESADVSTAPLLADDPDLEEKLASEEALLLNIDAELIAVQDNYRVRYFSAPNLPPVGVADLRRQLDDYTYLIGPRDVLTVVVFNNPQLTNPTGEFRSEESAGRLVRADGHIFFPFVGSVKAAGRTVEEVRQEIATRLDPFIRKPQVDVRVASFRSKKVYVTGEVKQPGVYYLSNEPTTIVDALSQAGGFSEFANKSEAILTHNSQRFSINTQALYQDGRAANNILLRDGDTVHVPDNRYQRIFVLGEVKEQAALDMPRGRMTLAEAVSESGGFDFDTSNPGAIYVVRGLSRDTIVSRSVKNRPQAAPVALAPIDGADVNAASAQAAGFQTRRETNIPVVFRLDARSPDAFLLADQFELAPRDVVFVSTNDLARWNRVVKQLLPTVQTIFQSNAFIRSVD